MLKGVYDLLLAKQNEILARRGYIEALKDYWIAWVNLERATGGKLPEVKTPAKTSPKPAQPQPLQGTQMQGMQHTHHHGGGNQ